MMWIHDAVGYLAIVAGYTCFVALLFGFTYTGGQEGA